MPRAYSHSHLVNGKLVGFSVRKFAHLTGYVACFCGPDGRRLQRATNMMRLGQAIEAARVLIENEYCPPVLPLTATWKDAIDRLTARLKTSGNRLSTLGYYLKLIRLVRAVHDTVGPADITPERAAAWRAHQVNNEFSPQRLYYWVETLFADYQNANPDRHLTSHMFRKRAFTLAWEAGIDMRQASIAYGCNVDTLMKHYVAMNEEDVTDSVFARMHSNNSQTNGRRLKPKTA